MARSTNRGVGGAVLLEACLLIAFLIVGTAHAAPTGEFRAPRSRASLDLFYWFCLEHVRVYNSAWNYYAGMSAHEIEREIRNDTVWLRTLPSTPRGTAPRR